MNNSLKTILFGTAMILLTVSCAKDGIDTKVENLLSQMTLREKIGQMNQLAGGHKWIEQIKAGECGSVLNCNSPEEILAVQKAAVEQSRLGIPLLISRDVIHGYHTIFPIPLPIIK